MADESAVTVERGYTVDVTHTDRTRQPDGHYTEYRARVDVLADGPGEATLIAAQLVAAVRDNIVGMVIATAIVL